MANEYDDLKLYNLSEAQELFPYLMKFSIFKNVANIPFCLLLKQDVDWDVMQEAYKIEVQRNDSLRMRFVKTKEGVKQYFLPEVDLPKVEYKDFSDSTEDQMMVWLNQKASKAFKFYKGEVYEVAFFNTPDGQSGIFANVFHMAMDTYAMILLLQDLVDVYAALKNGTEIPAPLTKFEDSLQHDLDYVGSQREETDMVFFKELWENVPPVQFCGIDGGRILQRVREKKKDPNHMAVPNFAMFKNKTRQIICHVDKATTDRWSAFAEGNGVTYQTLVHLGIHLALTAMNGCVDATAITFTINRRTKLADQRCGGDRVHGHNVLTETPKDAVVKEVLAEVATTQMKEFRHADYSTTKALGFLMQSQNFDQTESITSITYSLLPPGSVETPEGFDCDLIVLNPGRFMTNAMHTIFPNLRKGGMDFTYRHYIAQFTEEDTYRFHDLFVKAVEGIIANSDGKIADIYEILTK